MKWCWLVLALGACGDNEGGFTWQGADRIAAQECTYGGTAITQIALDGDTAYWAGGCYNEAPLWKTSLRDGTTSVLTKQPAGVQQDWCTHGVFLHADDVYFTTGCGGTVRKIGKNGQNESEVLAPDSKNACIHQLVGDDATLYISSAQVLALPFGETQPTIVATGQSAGAIGLRSNSLVWSGLDLVNNEVVGVAKESQLPAEPPILVTNVDSDSALAVTETDYVVAFQNMLQHLDAAHHVNVIAPLDQEAIDVKIDGGDVYWIDRSGVYRSPLAGGAVTTLASTTEDFEGHPGLALDRDRVYWTDGCGLLAAPR